MIKTFALLLGTVALLSAAEEPTTAAAVPQDKPKDQKAEPSYLNSDYLDLGSVSSGLLSPDSWKPISGPPSQHIGNTGASNDVKTITLTKHVPVPYHVTVEKRVPVRVEVPVDKPYPVYVPRPYHVYVEKKVPYHVGVPVPQPYTVEKHVPVPVKVPVDKPVPVAVPQPYPVFMYRKVPYTVERHVPYPVKIPFIRPYPVHVPVEKRIPVPIEKVVPYPVHVAVERPVPVHVEKPVPYPVEKLVPYAVEKIVPVPYKVPIKIPVKVHVPLPVIGHYSGHESGIKEVYSSTDNSQQHPTYQVDETREETNDTPPTGAEYSEVYAQSAQNQWPQLGLPPHHPTDGHPHDGHIRFPQEHEGISASTNLILQDQDSSHHQVGAYIKVDQGQSSQGPEDGQYQEETTITHNQNQGYGSEQKPNHEQQKHHTDSGTTLQHPRGATKYTQPHSTDTDISEFEKRLKDGRQESYSKINLGPTAYTNTIQHGRVN